MTAETIVAAMPRQPPTVLPTEPVEAGKGGEGGDFQITNAEFIAAGFHGPARRCLCGGVLEER